VKLIHQARKDNSSEATTGWLWVVVLLSVVAASYGQDATLVIDNARVIVGDGTVKGAGTVVIATDRIASVSAERPQLEGVKRIDARGKTVMPGLIDTHMHFFGLTARGEAGFRAQIEILAPTYMQDFLRHGVTTVKSLADPLDLVLELRNQVREGKLKGPRVLLVGPCFTAPGGHPAVTLGKDDPWMRSAIGIEVDSEDAARREVRRLAARGVDAVKAALEAGGGPGVPDTMPRLSVNVLEAIVDEAHRHKLRVTVHTHREQDVLDAIACGADGVEHGVTAATLSDDNVVNALLEKDVVYTPTLWIMSQDQQADSFAIARQNLKTLSDKGVRITVGTDTLCSMPSPGLNTIQEMEFMAEAGLKPERIIQAGTRDAAEHLGLLDELGTVEPGKIADLILVAGDPLEDVSALHQVQMVIQAGQVVYDAGEDEATALPKGIPSDANPVAWFEIPVTDMARAKAFYEHVLNVKLQPLNIGPLEMAYFPMRPGTPGAAGALMKGEAFRPSQQGVQIYFFTPDVDSALRRVQERDGKIVLTKTQIGPLGFIALFEDSEGNRIGLRSWQ
jgi:imidazolonepropionase-like amidohydrolase/predicted enzyme related to lactoylglutathione lyase